MAAIGIAAVGVSASGTGQSLRSPSSGGSAAPAAGDREAIQSIAGSIVGSVYLDVNGNHVIDPADTFLVGVPIALRGTLNGSASSAGAPAPSYIFNTLAAGRYTVAVPTMFDGHALAASTPHSIAAAVTAGEDITGVDFLYEPGNAAGAGRLDADGRRTMRGGLSGIAYVDANGNNVWDRSEPPLAGVNITVAGLGTITTSADGRYAFKDVPAGTYSVGASTSSSGFALSTPSPHSADLQAVGDLRGVDFGYRAGVLSGFAYVDTNRNRRKDVNEPGLAGVSIVLSNQGTTLTGPNGGYSFIGLTAAAYTVAAPSSAFGHALVTSALLSTPLAAGGSVPDLDFGYEPAVGLRGQFLAVPLSRPVGRSDDDTRTVPVHGRIG